MTLCGNPAIQAANSPLLSSFDSARDRPGIQLLLFALFASVVGDPLIKPPGGTKDVGVCGRLFGLLPGLLLGPLVEVLYAWEGSRTGNDGGGLRGGVRRGSGFGGGIGGLG